MPSLLPCWIEWLSIWGYTTIVVQARLEMFAKKWCEITGLSPKLETSQRIYKIERVKIPKGIRGQFVQAASIDTQLVAQWMHEFTMDAIPHEEKTK